MWGWTFPLHRPFLTPRLRAPGLGLGPGLKASPQRGPLTEVVGHGESIGGNILSTAWPTGYNVAA